MAEGGSNILIYMYFGSFLVQKIYLVNPLERNCRKSLIPFHPIWRLCWYNFWYVDMPSHLESISSRRRGEKPCATVNCWWTPVVDNAWYALQQEMNRNLGKFSMLHHGLRDCWLGDVVFAEK